MSMVAKAIGVELFTFIVASCRVGEKTFEALTKREASHMPNLVNERTGQGSRLVVHFT